jgi:hypothetical protein
VNDNNPEIEQHPSGIIFTLPAKQFDPFPGESLVDRVTGSMNLALAVGTANNEIVGEGGYRLDIQQDDISSLFIEGGLYGLLGYISNFQN